jgi:hypothetical protein
LKSVQLALIPICPGLLKAHTGDLCERVNSIRSYPQLDNLIARFEVFGCETKRSKSELVEGVNNSFGVTNAVLDKISISPVYLGILWKARA